MFELSIDEDVGSIESMKAFIVKLHGNPAGPRNFNIIFISLTFCNYHTAPASTRAVHPARSQPLTLPACALPAGRAPYQQSACQ